MATDDAEADPLGFARRIALAKLATRAHSAAELRAALAKKNVPDDVIDALLGRLTEVGLVDDADFADQWVRSRHEYRKSSRSVLRRELKVKGVADDEIASALATVDDDAELAAAEHIAEKKMRSLGGLEVSVARRRLAGALARRGFAPSVVADVVRRYASIADDE